MLGAGLWSCPVTIRAILYACLLGETLAAQIPAKVDFARDIQPILRDHCVECHGPSQQMRGLRLDRRRDAMPNRVGANGARIVPGKSAGSPLFRRLSGTQFGVQMPPAGPLRPEQINIIKAWIDQGADWPDALSGDRDAAPADPAVMKMMNSLRNGNRPEFKRTLLENPESVNAKGQGGWTPIMYAALYGDSEEVRLLLDKGANPNAQNDDGGTALMYAVEDGEKTRLLLNRGANPNLRSGEGRTALLIAAGWAGSFPAVKLLLENGADAGVRLPDGRGALTVAVAARNRDLLQLLLDHGAGKKPLPLGASLAGCSECFDLLLELAEPGDLSGALQGAVRAGDLPRTKMLLGRGAQPGPNLLQAVALSPATFPVDTIRTLIRRGANVNAKTSAGLTMLDFAKRQGNVTLVEALTEAGVRDESPAPVQLRPKPAGPVRAAIERSIPGLQRADVAFLQRAGCVSCHNNSLTAMTVAAARAKGMRVDEQIAKDQLHRIAAFLRENGERALENDGIPGGVDTVSYILLGMAVENYPSDPITDVWARYVKNNQSPDGRWRCLSLRPPLESSDFEVTAASIRSVRTYGPKSQRAEYDKAVERAVHWLEMAQPQTTEDHAFKIFGLIWGGGSRQAIRTTAQKLLALQRSGGAWGQVPTLATDAYATGQALVALRESRVIAVSSPAYQRGIQYLLNSQLEDGSWYVRTRAAAIQPYFDSDFPHGPDQFISAAASNWASMALATVVR
ncbi:MAG: ankyrin repeat domain-containing protein [Bryobacteraceae bacterium]